jgi:hypothetical protein
VTTAELPVIDPAIALRSGQLRRLWKEQRPEPLIDVYHGEMRFHMHPQVQQAILDTVGKINTEDADLVERDGSPFDKAQPRILRQLAAERLYERWCQAGLAVMASVARPDGVILCPVGFYKSNRQHIEKLGLSVRLIPASPDNDGKISPRELRRAIKAHREHLCALLLTMPGNPLIAAYTADELQAIGRVVIEEDVRVIIDATLDAVVADYLPLAAVTVDCAGTPRSLFDRTVTIAGLSKGHHAVGPYKLGAAITGNAGWRADIRRQLAVPLQRETTAVARVVLERTPREFFEHNRKIMAQAQDQARQLCDELEARFGFPVVIPVGSSRQGPFLLIRLAG